MRNDIFLIEMGKKIRERRKAQKISLQKLSEVTGIDLSNLSFLERGQRNCHILSLKSIADCLNLNIKELL